MRIQVNLVAVSLVSIANLICLTLICSANTSNQVKRNSNYQVSSSFTRHFYSSRKCRKLKRLCQKDCEPCCILYDEHCTKQKFEIIRDTIDEVNKEITGESAISRLSKPVMLYDGVTRVELLFEAELQQMMKVKQIHNQIYAEEHGLDVAEDSEKESPFFGGDVVFTAEQIGALLQNLKRRAERRQKRKFQVPTEVAEKWPLTIYYVFDSEANADQETIDAMNEAVDYWRAHTCLTIVNGLPPDGPDGDYIVVTKGAGCSSMVGIVGGPQMLSLGSGCEQMGIAAHEIGHTLGLWHEQSRPDRDQHVRIGWENINPEAASNFYKCEDNTECRTNGIPYDYGSVMHYGAKAFSVTGRNTILPNDVEYMATIGSRTKGPSFYDVKQINKEYCGDTCAGNDVACHNGGYPRPRICDKCICPDGFAGNLCEDVAEGRPDPCGGLYEPTNEWQTIQSPNYPSAFQDGQECSWRLKGPAESQIEFEFDGDVFEFPYSSIPLCDWSYVEVRHSSDMANTGARYCGFKIPTRKIISDINEMVVLLRSKRDMTSRGFHARFRIHGSEDDTSADCSLTEWASWSICDSPCGGGIQERDRRVIEQATGLGKPCNRYKLEEFQFCNLQECRTSGPDRDCEVSPWSGFFGECSATCGEGYKYRLRSVLRESSGDGIPCSMFQLREGEKCHDIPECPPACEDDDWSEWSTCSATCGLGKQNRMRITRFPAESDDCLEDKEEQQQDCESSVECPADCELTEWSRWSDCSATCGEGERSRTRDIISEAEGGGQSCSYFAQREADECPNLRICESCVLSDWSSWSDCSTTCGPGKEERQKAIISEEGPGGCDDQFLKDVRECIHDDCEEEVFDCRLTEWTEWTDCSATCGTSSRQRSRIILEQAKGGQECSVLPLTETSYCKVPQECDDGAPQNCLLDDWTSWTECTATCGANSIKRRSRKIIQLAENGGTTCENKARFEAQACGLDPCQGSPASRPTYELFLICLVAVLSLVRYNRI